MNKLIEAKAFQIGEYWYICARLPLEEGDAVVLPKNSPTPEVKIVSPSNILLKEQQVENEIRASYEGIIKDLKKRLDEKGDIILSVDDLHKKEIAYKSTSRYYCKIRQSSLNECSNRYFHKRNCLL